MEKIWIMKSANKEQVPAVDMFAGEAKPDEVQPAPVAVIAASSEPTSVACGGVQFESADALLAHAKKLVAESRSMISFSRYVF